MIYIIDVLYRVTLKNEGETAIHCDYCGATVGKDYTHQCEHIKPVEVSLPGTIVGLTYNQA